MADEHARPRPGAPIEQYTPEALAACEKALRTIIARVGAWGPRLILFGGLAPRYLIDAPPDDVEAHTGTTDLDVVIGIELEVDDPGVYTKLQQELTNAGFTPGAHSFEWERRIDGVLVVLEFFCPVESGARPGTLKRNPGGATGAEISAIRLRGADIAADDCTVRMLSGEILDHGGHRDVEIRVVNILPFLVLKSFALDERDKEKDAYDIVWTLNAFGDAGPESAAEAAAGSPVVDNEDVEEAMRLLERSFRDLNAKGPSNYAKFFLGGRDDTESERTERRRFARGTVVRFLDRWREVRSG